MIYSYSFILLIEGAGAVRIAFYISTYVSCGKNSNLLFRMNIGTYFFYPQLLAFSK